MSNDNTTNNNFSGIRAIIDEGESLFNGATTTVNTTGTPITPAVIQNAFNRATESEREQQEEELRRFIDRSVALAQERTNQLMADAYGRVNVDEGTESSIAVLRDAFQRMRETPPLPPSPVDTWITASTPGLSTIYREPFVAADPVVNWGDAYESVRITPPVPGNYSISLQGAPSISAAPSIPTGTAFSALLRGVRMGDALSLTNYGLTDRAGELSVRFAQVISQPSLNRTGNDIIMEVIFSNDENKVYKFELENPVYFDENLKPLNHWGYRTA